MHRRAFAPPCLTKRQHNTRGTHNLVFTIKTIQTHQTHTLVFVCMYLAPVVADREAVEVPALVERRARDGLRAAVTQGGDDPCVWNDLM